MLGLLRPIQYEVFLAPSGNLQRSPGLLGVLLGMYVLRDLPRCPLSVWGSCKYYQCSDRLHTSRCGSYRYLRMNPGRQEVAISHAAAASTWRWLGCRNRSFLSQRGCGTCWKYLESWLLATLLIDDLFPQDTLASCQSSVPEIQPSSTLQPSFT